MERPFQILRSTIASRQEFTVRDGYQETHAIFYLKEGSFRIEIDGVVEKIQAGDCVILPNDVRFRRNVVSPIVFVYIKFARTPGIEAVPLPHGKIRFRDRARFLSTIAAMEKLMDREDDLSVAYQEHLLCLQEYIEGTTYGNNQLPHSLLMQAAELLGQLHTLLKDYPLPVEMDVPWLEAFSAENCAVEQKEKAYGLNVRQCAHCTLGAESQCSPHTEERHLTNGQLSPSQWCIPLYMCRRP